MMPATPNRAQADRFKDAMSLFPSGATIVTTTDESGHWWGFTATAFCSVSVAPPLVLACLAKTAQCYPIFERAQRWIVHILHIDHTELAFRFATTGADKFHHAGFQANADGLPVLWDASVVLDCSKYQTSDGGDHTILLGRVNETFVGEAPPSVYFRRKFHALSSFTD